MFIKLLRFELKKVFNNKKCIILFALMLAVTGIFIASSIEQTTQQQYEKIDATNAELATFKAPYKKDPELYNANAAYYNKKCAAYNDKLSALKNFKWKDELTCDIQLKNIEIDNLKSQGITDENSFKDYKNTIKEESWYVDNNVQPVDAKKSILGPFFIINFFRTIFPLLVVLMLIMTISDTFSGEFDEGSYKLLFIQPVKRAKILFSKLIVSIIFNLVFFFSGILPLYFILSNINTFFTGKGSFIHPVTINKNLMAPFTVSSPAVSTSGEEFKYIFVAAIVAIIMVTCIGFLVSCLCSSSAQSIIISTVVAIALYSISSVLSSTSVDFLSIITYADPVTLIEGHKNSFLNVAVQFMFAAVFSAILIIVSIITVKHKDFDK